VEIAAYSLGAEDEVINFLRKFLKFFCTANCGTIMQQKPMKYTLLKLML